MKIHMREKPGGVELSSLNYKYEHHLGYFVAIEKGDIDRFGLDLLKDACELELVYRTNEDSCWMFKDARCNKLDTDLGDVKGTLLSMEMKVIRYLEAKIKPLCTAANAAASAVAQLDCLLAFAATAEKNNWNRPDVSNNAEGKSSQDPTHISISKSCYVLTMSGFRSLYCGRAPCDS